MLWKRSDEPSADSETRQSHADVTTERGGNAQRIAARGWASRLAVVVTSLVVIQSVTGLWLFFASFSVGSELQLLVHVGAGLLMMIPYVGYQLRHFLTWRQQKWSVVMVLGYLLMTAVVACTVSGVVVTGQALLGPKLGEAWDLVHVVAGIATSILLVVHLLLALRRRWPSAKAFPDLAHAVLRFGYRGLLMLGSVAGATVMATWMCPAPRVEFPPPPEYRLSHYVEQYDEYRGNPFAPTYARTSSGMLVDPTVLSNSQKCGTAGCHEQILAEWEPSAHRFSAMNPPFQQVQKNFAADRDPAETRYCAGCHDPISLFAGAKDIHHLDLSAPGMQEGCSCIVCHSISQVDQRGNADYVVTPPKKYLWEDQEGWRKRVSDFLIRAYPRQHLEDYDRPLLRSPEFCGACHKQFIPEALNRFGLTPGQNQYDEWRKSHWHVDDPDRDLSCIDCHMRLVRDSTDPGRGEEGAVRRSAGDGAHRHHGMIATNMFMPNVLKLPHWEQQVQRTEQWIRGETVIDEIAHIWPEGPVASVQIIAPDEAEPEQEVAVRTVVVNRKAGHNFTTGPLDFTRAWIHLRVHDADGNAIAEWGAIDPETRRITDGPDQPHRIGNSRKEGTLVLEGGPLDQHGQPLVQHELWKKAGGSGKRVVFPGYSDNQVYRFRVPSSAKGPLTVKADLNYRRYRQEFLDLAVPDMERDSGVYQPTVTQSSDEKHVTIVGAG